MCWKEVIMMAFDNRKSSRFFTKYGDSWITYADLFVKT